MRLLSTYGENEFGYFSSDFFAKPPLRSWGLLGESFLPVLVMFLIGFVAVKGWHQLRVFSLVWMGLAVTHLLLLLLLSWKIYSRLHKLHAAGQLGTGTASSPLDSAISAAAFMIHYSLFYGPVAAAAILLALAPR